MKRKIYDFWVKHQTACLGVLLFLACYSCLWVYWLRDSIYGGFMFSIANYEKFDDVFLVICFAIGGFHGIRRQSNTYTLKLTQAYLGPLPSSIGSALGYGLAIVGCFAIAKFVYVDSITGFALSIDKIATAITLIYLLIAATRAIGGMIKECLEKSVKESHPNPAGSNEESK